MSKHATRFNFRGLEKAVLRTLRSLPVLRAHRDWMQMLAERSDVDAMLRGKGDYRTRHLQSYMHRRWSASRKLTLIQSHVDFMQEAVCPLHRAALYEDTTDTAGIVLSEWQTGDQPWRLMLLRSQHNKEGELQLSLQDGEGHEVYFMVFSIGRDHSSSADRALFIGCVQGARPESGGTALINAFYKQHHGLRAQSLLITVLYALADVFEIKQLFGIADKYTVNSRYRTKIKTSYDAFWQECHGQYLPAGWYQLPQHEVLRSIDTVKSKHRSAFRKREAWRDTARADIRAALEGLRPMLTTSLEAA